MYVCKYVCMYVFMYVYCLNFDCTLNIEDVLWWSLKHKKPCFYFTLGFHFLQVWAETDNRKRRYACLNLFFNLIKRLPQRTEKWYYPAFVTVVRILNNSVSARVERYSNSISYGEVNVLIPSSFYCTIISLFVR